MVFIPRYRYDRGYQVRGPIISRRHMRDKLTSSNPLGSPTGSPEIADRGLGPRSCSRAPIHHQRDNAPCPAQLTGMLYNSLLGHEIGNQRGP